MSNALYKLPNGKFTPTYISWIAMKQRCLNPNAEKYKTYGAKGITICQRWIESFADFYKDMGPRPEGRTIDRKNTNGNYEPDNCKWSTAKEQAENRNPFDTSNALKSHCPSGHDYVGDNVRITTNGDRKCRTCEREQAKTRRGMKPKVDKAPKSRCINGHDLSPENIRVRGNHRVCKLCQRDVSRKLREKGRVIR